MSDVFYIDNIEVEILGRQRRENCLACKIHVFYFDIHIRLTEKLLTYLIELRLRGVLDFTFSITRNDLSGIVECIHLSNIQVKDDEIFFPLKYHSWNYILG